MINIMARISLWVNIYLLLFSIEHVIGGNWRYALKSHPVVFPPPSKHVKHPLDDTGSSSSSSTPLTFFEAGKASDLPATTNHICSTTLLTYTFGDTSNSAPVSSRYVPCTDGAYFDKVVLTWAGVASGRQFGRIATVWLARAEILRSCTPEPADGGGTWTLQKDVTRFTALLKKPRAVAMELGNVLDSVYSGSYAVNITLDFYDTGLKRQFANPDPSLAPPHRVLPLSLPKASNGGFWFRIGGSDASEDSVSTQLQGLPRNSYRAVLEICVSFHGDDESWYTNPPNEYAQANNLTYGNGPFREISAYLDGQFLGAVWPFPVVYTGGFNPLVWRPAAPIGSFVLPSYDLEITPFIGTLVDGQAHTFTFTVTNALSVWLLDATLHLWIDDKVTSTQGALLSSSVPSFSPVGDSQFSGVDGLFHVTATRNYSFSGQVTSSKGTITTCVTSSLYFNNTLLLKDQYGYQSDDLLITSQTQVLSTNTSVITASYQKSTQFPFHILCLQSNGPDSNSTYLNCSISHALDYSEYAMFPKGTIARVLKNVQNAEGDLTVDIENTVTNGMGTMQQQYDYKSNVGCYQRTLSVMNSAILSDSTTNQCTPCSDFI